MLPVEKSCGVILVLRKDNNEDRFLILQQKPRRHWSFPKGHIEGNETPIETAIRELREETGITDVEFAKLPSIIDNYVFELNNKKCDKTVELFIAFTTNNNVIPQEDEVMDYKWATYEEALETLNYIETRNVLKTAQKYLQDMVK